MIRWHIVVLGRLNFKFFQNIASHCSEIIQGHMLVLSDTTYYFPLSITKYYYFAKNLSPRFYYQMKKKRKHR